MLISYFMKLWFEKFKLLLMFVISTPPKTKWFINHAEKDKNVKPRLQKCQAPGTRTVFLSKHAASINYCL